MAQNTTCHPLQHFSGCAWNATGCTVSHFIRSLSSVSDTPFQPGVNHSGRRLRSQVAFVLKHHRSGPHPVTLLPSLRGFVHFVTSLSAFISQAISQQILLPSRGVTSL